MRALGGPGLADAPAPASAVMQHALGAPGARLIELGIAISTLGFLSQSMLTAPRVYFAMAEDGVFFARVARIHPRTRVPVTAIALQESPDLKEFSGRVSDSGEGRWTSIAAIDEGVPTPVLTTALQSRFASRQLDDFANKALSAMRKQFGGHAEKPGVGG